MTSLSTSRAIVCGVPPNTGARYRLYTLRSHFPEIDEVPVRRKCQTVISAGRGRDDLGIAARRHIAQPQTLHPIVVRDAEDVLTIRRNGGLRRLSRIRDLRDGEVLERHCCRAMRNGVDTKTSRQRARSRPQSHSP